MTDAEDFDNEGVSIPGAFPISTVRIGGWSGKDNTPCPNVDSAVCDACGRWATCLWTAGEAKCATDDIVKDARISRRTTVIAFACPEHSDQVKDSLMDEWGFAVNRYEPDDLALEVDRQDRMRFTEQRH